MQPGQPCFALSPVDHNPFPGEPHPYGDLMQFAHGMMAAHAQAANSQAARDAPQPSPLVISVEPPKN